MPIRTPTPQQIEKLRLILSSYQDGTGQLAQSDGTTLPGWRNFERTVALIFRGTAQESKAIFDVLVPKHREQGNLFGIACKMRRELKYPKTTQEEVPLELSNAAKQFWAELKDNHKLNEQSYKQDPNTVGEAIITLVNKWHEDASLKMGIDIDLDESFYLILLWNKEGYYQLFQYPHKLPNPKYLHWHFPILKDGTLSNHLRGEDRNGKVFEWYGESGGQLKYYPRVENALWTSRPFRLETLPHDMPNGVLSRVKAYFPHQWEATKNLDE